MRKVLCLILTAVLLAGCLAGCGGTPNFPVEIGGASLKKKPTAIVGLTPYINEIFYGLEKSELLVGRSEYCAFNGNVRGLPSCGTVEAPDVEKIIELAPQLVISSVALPQDAARRLTEAEIQICVLPVPADIHQVSERIRQVAALTAGNNRAETLAEGYLSKLNNELEYVSAKLSGISEKTAVFILSGDGAVATGDTLIGDVMRLAGLKNIAENYRDYTMPADEILAADPEIVIVGNPPSIEWLMMSDFGGLSQVSAGMAFEVDYEYVESYAPSVTNLLYGLAYAIYPDAMSAPDLPDDPDASYPSKPDILPFTVSGNERD